METKILNKKVGCALIAASLLAASGVQGSQGSNAQAARSHAQAARNHARATRNHDAQAARGDNARSVCLVNVCLLPLIRLGEVPVNIVFPCGYRLNCNSRLERELQIVVFPADGDIDALREQGFPGYTTHYLRLVNGQTGMIRLPDPTMTTMFTPEGYIAITPPLTAEMYGRRIGLNIRGILTPRVINAGNE
jgi:hypothetical protein